MSAPLDPFVAAPALGEPLASRFIDGEAIAHPLDIPGIADTVAWSVRDETGPHPIWANVGRLGDGRVLVLSGDQAAWAELARDAGAHLPDAATALAYVKAFLGTTRGTMVVVRPVADIADLPWRPGSPEEEARKAALLADPPDLAERADTTPEGFHVELGLVVDDRLQRNRFDVTADGAVTASFDVIAEALPFPRAR